ncbi:hypothetical protein J6590_098140 [Homalodisca vitripennis]|nr:hypothetical protein J6590_098140 [Homalodisca vitripennis]
MNRSPSADWNSDYNLEFLEERDISVNRTLAALVGNNPTVSTGLFRRTVNKFEEQSEQSGIVLLKKGISVAVVKRHVLQTLPLSHPTLNLEYHCSKTAHKGTDGTRRFRRSYTGPVFSPDLTVGSVGSLYPPTLAPAGRPGKRTRRAMLKTDRPRTKPNRYCAMVDRGKLISLVRDKATLWDQRDKFYHNRDFRSKLWEEVAKELNVQGDEARKTWEHLRDTFRKKVKENKSGSGAKPTWTYFESLTFLLPVMKPRVTTGNLPVSDTPVNTLLESEDYADLTEHDETSTLNIDEPDESPNVERAQRSDNTSTPSPTPVNNEFQRPRQKRKRGSTIQNEALNLEKRKVQLLEARFAVQKSSSMEEEDEDLSFFKSLLPALKKLPYLRKMKLKASIFNSVIAELEAEERCNRPYQSVNTPLSSPQSGNFGGYNLNNPYASTSRPTTPHTETWPTPNDQIQTPPYTNTFENL